MKAIESSLRLISFHMPAFGRCNIISMGMGGSDTSNATMRSTTADSISVKGPETTGSIDCSGCEGFDGCEGCEGCEGNSSGIQVISARLLKLSQALRH